MDGDLPANVRIVDYVPFELLLPDTDLPVTNGGHGAVNAALRHGVPQLRMPRS